MAVNLFFVKVVVTAAVVVAASEVAHRSDRIGAIVAALPLVTLLVLVWLHVEGRGEQKVARHAFYTFWYVLPTLPMFLAFPWLLAKVGFWWSLGASAVITVGAFIAVAAAVRPFGIDLVP